MNPIRLPESARPDESNSSAKASFASRLWDFIGSMRFAVSILSVVAIASAIGTIIKQNESKLNYIDKFGEFWASVFAVLGMDDVYNQAWFLVMLVFLLASTSICLIRNTPKMLHDMRTYKLHNRTKSLAYMPEHAQWHSSLSTDELTARVAQFFERMGYQARANQADIDGQTSVYFAAKRGRYNRLGYILTHLAIVVICLGGLLDSELSIRAQVLFMGKTPLTNMTLYKDVPASGVLSNSTLSYRGSVRIPEGQSFDFVELAYNQNTYLLQDLPFWVRLDKFNVEYYSTGMPKLFASDVTIKDKTTGQEFSQTISVNHPLRYKGVALYQANFDANESVMHLKIHPLFGAQTDSKSLDAKVGGQSEFPFGTKKFKLEWRGFKPINVFPTNEDAKGTTTEAFAHAMSPKGEKKQFQNFGASVTYVLRDDAGNSSEYVQYATPVVLDGAPVYISARRDSLEQDYQYFRIPADEDASVADFMRLRAALADEATRLQIAQRYVQTHPTTGVPAEKMTQGIAKTLAAFATGGLEGLGQQIESTVVESERDKIASSLVRVLEESLWDGLQIMRAKENLPARTQDEAHQKFIRMSLYSLSEFRRYGSPVMVELASMDVKQASGLQATRSPGQWWVYLGSVMLVLGTLAMAFIRERRIWLHITPNSAGTSSVSMAMSSTRRTFDYQQHWQVVREGMEQALQPELK
jgi:cytochrome c biogenesis protein